MFIFGVNVKLICSSATHVLGGLSLNHFACNPYGIVFDMTDKLSENCDRYIEAWAAFLE